MTNTITIDRRFCGPPDSGNGGYVCGVLASHLGAPGEVTLRRPPPLKTPMTVAESDGGTLRLLDQDEVVAEATPGPDNLGLDVPAPPSVAEARAASARSRYLAHPDQHPFPTCFVCGPAREPKDGLRILVAPLDGRDLSADVWIPDPELTDADRAVRPEFVWAALDCPSGIGAMGDAPPKGPPFVLGRLSVRQLLPVLPAAPLVVVGWRIGEAGRKLLAGSALFTARDQLAALARATWIRLN
jgi:hypothetical protein